MRDFTLIVIIAAWFVAMFCWYVSYTKDYPQCLLARDVVTCVEIARKSNGR